MNKKINYIVSRQGDKLENAFENDKSVDDQPFMKANEICTYIAERIPRKSLQWVVNRYINRDFFLEDIDDLGKDLKLFFENANHHGLDINKLTKEGFYRVVVSLSTDVDTVKNKRVIKAEGTEKLVNSDIVILNVLTANAAAYYAAGTKWCTSNSSTFENYLKRGPIYIIIDKKSNRKFQLHMDSGQFKNELDVYPTEDDINLLSKSPDWGKFIEKLVLETYPQLR